MDAAMRAAASCKSSPSRKEPCGWPIWATLPESRLAQLSQAGVYFLMPLKDGVVTWLAGKRVDVLELLSSHGQEEEQEYAIILGAGKQVPCRLFARRATPMQIKRRHEAQDEYARKHGTQVTQRQRDWAQWTLVISNVPACLLSLAEAFILLRARWQR